MLPGSYQVNLRTNVNALLPKVGANSDGSMRYYAWADDRLKGGSSNGRPRRDVYFANSQMVASPLRYLEIPPDVRLDGQPGRDGDAVDLQLAASGAKVYVAWVDRFSDGSTELFLRGSQASGQPGSWSNLLYLGSCRRVRGVDMLADVSGVYITWTTDLRDGTGVIRCARFQWNRWTLLAEAISWLRVSDGSKRVYTPKIAKSSTHLYLTYGVGDWGKEDIYFRSFVLGRGVWWSPPQRLDSGDALGATQSHSPVLAAAGDNICAVWVDDREGSPAIYATTSADFGATWSPAQRISTGGALSARDPKVVFSGNRFYAVWSEYQSGWQIFHRRAIPTSSAANWDSSSQRLDSGTVGATKPSIAAAGDNVMVCWEDGRHSLPTIYGNYTNDGGNTWQSSDAPIGTQYPGYRADRSPEVVVRVDRVDVVFLRFRYGTPDVFTAGWSAP